MEDIQGMQDILSRIMGFIASQAPGAWDTICEIERLDCILGTIACFVVLIISATTLYFVYKYVSRNGWDSDLVLFLGCSASVAGGIALLMLIFDTWGWIGMFRPDLKIIHDLYGNIS